MKLVLDKELGYYQIQPAPSSAELELFYKKTPLGSTISVPEQYAEEELAYNLIGCKESDHYLRKSAKTFLDVGCGEGFFLDYFQKKGMTVEGVDFTDDNVRKFFPQLTASVITGDLLSSVQDLKNRGKKYDFIGCNNVLEHVTDPRNLLAHLRSLLAPKGLLRIVVPNDFSPLQAEAVQRKCAAPDFWVCPPAHLSYFNAENFPKILEHAGFRVNAFLGEFPIEFFLFNSDSNYIQDKSKGKKCHWARIWIENLLCRTSIERLIAFRKGCAAAGIGRSLIAYCTAA